MYENIVFGHCEKMKIIKNPEQIKLQPKPKIWKFKDLEGQRFGQLYAVGYIGRLLNGDTYWLLHCDCGTYVQASVRALRSGKRTSCGCAGKLHRQAQQAKAKIL
jgi:hypothetical protein